MAVTLWQPLLPPEWWTLSSSAARRIEFLRLPIVEREPAHRSDFAIARVASRRDRREIVRWWRAIETEHPSFHRRVLQSRVLGIAHGFVLVWHVDWNPRLRSRATVELLDGEILSLEVRRGSDLRRLAESDRSGGVCLEGCRKRVGSPRRYRLQFRTFSGDAIAVSADVRLVGSGHDTVAPF